MKDEKAVIVEHLSNRKWRICSGLLYSIVNKAASLISFIPNKHQMAVLQNLWYLNVILKARQLGMSTFIAIFGLDYCLFNDNVSFGVIDQTLDDAKLKLEKIRDAYKNIPAQYRPFIPTITTDNKEEIVFSNGSRISVGTSHRGGTLNILWVSEHAVIGKKSPEKEREIRTGALNTVEVGQIIFLESTAAGSEGDFYKICIEAEKKKISEQKLSKLDFKFFFFPWWINDGYSLECPDDYVFTSEMVDYFDQLGIDLTRNQKYWYIKKRESLQEDIKSEFPSTSREAFEATDRDKYYQHLIEKAYQENRVCEFPIVPGVEVETWWDLGRSDMTSIIFTQKVGKEVRIVDFIEDNGEHISFFIDLLKKKAYFYGKCWLPHDAKAEVLSAEKSTFQYLSDAGFRCDLVDKLGIESGINEARRIFPFCFFRKSTSEKLLEHLEKYKKKWVDSVGQYIGQVHDEHSHSADAFRYMAVGIKEVTPQAISRDEQIKRDLGSYEEEEYDDNPFGF